MCKSHCQLSGLLINYGTACGIHSGLVQVVEVGKSVQCDMDICPLGIALGTTPFDNCPALIRLSDNPICCGTAERFSDSAPELASDVVNMELFVLAKIARHEKSPYEPLNTLQMRSMTMQVIARKMACAL